MASEAENIKFYDVEDSKDLSDQELENLKNELLSRKKCGNDLFHSKKYEEAIQQYTETLAFCPRGYFSDIQANLCYNIAISYKYLEEDLKTLENCTKAIELDDKYLKAYILRGKINEKAEKLEEALKDYKHMVELDPKNYEAVTKCSDLSSMIEVKNEQLKTEAIGKLKELGNAILKPFGLSTNNFNFVKNDNEGGYSINFQK